jgi:hypothetical protein
MEAVLLELFRRLEAIEAEHGEVTDTEVRDAMTRAVFDGFLKPVPDHRLPDNFKMFTKTGNKLVRAALAWFLPAARKAAEQDELKTFHQRLAAFQNLEVCTEATTCYNDFFGWWNPEHFDEEGNRKKA